MNIADALRLSIENIAHITTTTTTVLIEEPDNFNSYELQGVKLTGFSEFYGAIKLDVRDYLFTGNLIRSGELKRACDAIVFCKVRKKNCIFLIELKSNKTSGISQKFKNGYAFIEYLRKIFMSYYNVDIKGFNIISVLFDRKVSSRSKPSERELSGIRFFHKGFGKSVGKVDLRIYVTR